MNKLKLFICLSAVAVVTACSSGSKPNTLYTWNGDTYPTSVYQYLTQDGDPQEQLQKLEEIAQLDSGKKVPPGLYAQIGLLYGQLGNAGKMAEAYQKEMTLFPESTQYINFLLNKGKKVDTSTESTGNKKVKKGAKK
ncbi:DUF4810 domain-containing protein [Haemophilus haemolyticus]|uniref:DUF4810 domain-containing protein n=1 Tax=Haemophilus haemolyticus TaxID=726 RepID=UPI00025E628B|nr:DUF4810 domain-containing protein [Haemophilus haemolyticus]EIJ73074.1 putative lipoprotein [Haemophilus haemolyticus HK386]OBX40010.1 DUF4810 domain-containing protein [Haemophilus haemolyticus]